MAMRSTNNSETLNKSNGIVRRSFVDETSQSMDHTEMRNKIGVELFLAVPSDVICMLCSGVMRDPIRAVDGASYCRICYLSKPEFTSHDKIPPYEQDEDKAQIIAALKCYCWYRTNGCGWLGKKAEWEYHLGNCQYYPTNCLFCQETYIKIEESAHRAKCPYEICECGATFHKLELETHKHVCSLYLPCANCTMSVRHSEFEKHIKNCDYTFCRVCNEGFNREQMLRHVSTKIIDDKHSGKAHIKALIEDTKMAQNTINLNKISTLALKKEVEELKTEIANLWATRKDGSLLWMIENVVEKHRQAKLDNQPLYSPPFYSHENGYKMGAKIYLNGDGEGIDDHISLYFFLYKGRYDDILKWPFAYKVALHIITFGTEEPKIEIFTPEKTSMSFERPKNERNIPSGYKKFLPQEILNQDTYVKNGTLYIKMVTDTSNMYHP